MSTPRPCLALTLPRWSTEDAREVLRALERSGQSVGAFAAEHGLDPCVLLASPTRRERRAYYVPGASDPRKRQERQGGVRDRARVGDGRARAAELRRGGAGESSRCPGSLGVLSLPPSVGLFNGDRGGAPAFTRLQRWDATAKKKRPGSRATRGRAMGAARSCGDQSADGTRNDFHVWMPRVT